jgi:hypothetical protein
MVTDPITEKIRRRHDDIPQDGLFEIADKRSEEPQNKVAKPKVVGHQKCPVCGHEKVAVIRVLDDEFRPHRVLKAHDRVTQRGHRFPCKGTGTEIDI